jgi:hypothetical protein
MIREVLFICIITVFFASCENKEKKEGRELLNRIEQSFENEKFNTAKYQIDSLHIMFRKQIDLRKQADIYLHKIEKIENERNLYYFENLLPQKQKDIDSISEYFTLGKDDKIPDANRYIHKVLKKSDMPPLLKPYVYEDGKLILTSVYSGTSDCDYTSVKLLNMGYFVLAEATEQGQTYSFKIGDMYWRTMLLSEKESEEMARFISLYEENEIRILLKGNSCNYNYILAEKYRKAIRDAYYLSLYKRELSELKSNIDQTKSKLEFIDNKDK